MSEKKNLSSDYYKERSIMQELMKAQKNVEMFLNMEEKSKKEKQKEQKR